MIKFSNPTIDSFFQWLSENPAWMAFITIFIPLALLTVWAVRRDEKAAPPKHQMRPRSTPMSSYLLNLDRDKDFDFDFNKITLWVNEIDNSKEYV